MRWHEIMALALEHKLGVLIMVEVSRGDLCVELADWLAMAVRPCDLKLDLERAPLKAPLLIWFARNKCQRGSR